MPVLEEIEADINDRLQGHAQRYFPFKTGRRRCFTGLLNMNITEVKDEIIRLYKEAIIENRRKAWM